jgi:membrane protease YdiL (CAAX protease family)
LEKLSAVLGSRLAAAVVSSVVFAYAHAPLWGIGASTALLIPALFSALFYLWRRDLSANVLAHIAVDLVGVVINAPS